MPSRPVQALLAVEPGVDAEDVKDSLPGGGEDFHIVGVVTGADEALTWLRGGVADLLLVACAGYSDRALLLLDGVARQNPELNVMVLGQGSPNGFLRRAFEAGADDIVMLPATPEQIRFEIHKLMARKTSARSPPQNEHSRLVCILGPKGGTGKTLSSTNLSVCLAQRGERVALIDLDLQFGDVALCLGLPPEDGLRPRPVPGALDWDKLGAFMAHHSSGVHTLIAPRRPDQASAVGAELLREIYSILRQNYDWVIVDTPPGFRRGDHVDRPLDRHRHGRDARLALTEEHEARTRDARAHEVRHRPHLPLAQPRAQPRRHERVGCGSRARAHPGRVHPVRPRDPPHGQRGDSHRRRPPAVRAGGGLRPPDRPADGRGAPPPPTNRCPRWQHPTHPPASGSRRRLFGRKA